MPDSYHICFTFFGDIQYDSRLSKCARTLSEEGYKVTAVIAGEKREKRESPGIDLKTIFIPRSRSGKLRFLSYYSKAFWPALRSKADCYFASDLYSLPVAYLVAKFRRARLIYDSRELYSSIAALRDRQHIQRFWSYVERKIIFRADLVFTVNDALADSISNRYSIPKPTTLLNCPRKQTIRKSDRIRSILAIPPTTKILLYQGGLQPGRGIHIMLSTIRKIGDAVLVLMGSGSLKGEILAMIKRERLEQKVFVIDAVQVDDLLEYTSSAYAGLCLIENYGESYYHSLPNKLFEYVAAGVPVVASNFPEMSRFVDSNRVGICVDPEKEDEIAAAIQRILTDTELHKTFVRHCGETASRYTWENESLKLVGAIERLMERS
jgi:glycosyltransferase involved in cell wall biosynthesis